MEDDQNIVAILSLFHLISSSSLVPPPITPTHAPYLLLKKKFLGLDQFTNIFAATY